MCTHDVQLGSPMDYILAVEPAWIICSSLRTCLSLAVHTGNCSCISCCNACYTLCMRSKENIMIWCKIVYGPPQLQCLVPLWTNGLHSCIAMLQYALHSIWHFARVWIFLFTLSVTVPVLPVQCAEWDSSKKPTSNHRNTLESSRRHTKARFWRTPRLWLMQEIVESLLRVIIDSRLSMV